MPVPIATGLMAGIKLIEMITKQMERRANGEITDEQLDAEWGKMGIDLTTTNAAWEAALAAHRGED